MSGRTSHRITAVVAPLVGAALVLSACGGGSSEAETRPTIELTAGDTDFATLPPATTAPPVEEESAEETSTTQEYTIQSGDFPLGVADKFGTTLEDLMALNGWTVCGSTCPEFPGPGGTVRVPGAVAGSIDTDGGTGSDADAVASTGEGAGEEGETGEAIVEPTGDSCEAGSYTIESGDFEGRVADKFDITVDELRAANSSTADYNVFYPGLEIVIPARDNC